MADKNISYSALSSRCLCMKILLNRNRFYNKAAYLKFPFLIVEPTTDTTRGGDTDFGIKIQDDLCKGLLSSNNKFQIYGDLEVIKEIPAISEDESYSYNRQGNPSLI